MEILMKRMMMTIIAGVVKLATENTVWSRAKAKKLLNQKSWRKKNATESRARSESIVRRPKCYKMKESSSILFICLQICNRWHQMISKNSAWLQMRIHKTSESVKRFLRFQRFRSWVWVIWASTTKPKKSAYLLSWKSNKTTSNQTHKR